MLHSILQLLTWYTRDLLARFHYRDMAHRNKGLLYNKHTPGSGESSGMCCTPSDACGQDIVLLGGNVFVKRVEWWKKDDSPFHEFLLFFVEEKRESENEFPRKSVFLVDRNIADGSINKDDPAQEVGQPIRLTLYKDADLTEAIPPECISKARQAPRASLAADVLAYSVRLKKRTLKAGDRMVFSTNGTTSFIHTNPGDMLCRTLIIHGEFVSVPEIAALTRVVHDHHRSYDLMEFQCYWYSEIIYNTTQTLVRKAIKDQKLSLEKRLFEDILHKTKLKTGQFQFGSKQSYVKRGEPETPIRVYTEYLAAWDGMKQEIANLRGEIEAEARKVSL
jgi:hypothetical protein